MIRTSAHEPLAAANAYSQSKRNYKNTALECESQGVLFQPMVLETTGAWSVEALAVLKSLAKAAGLRSGRDASEILQEFLQASSATIRRANARAHLKRRAQDIDTEPGASSLVVDVEH